MSGREGGPCVHLPQHWGSFGTSLQPSITLMKYWKVDSIFCRRWVRCHLGPPRRVPTVLMTVSPISAPTEGVSVCVLDSAGQPPAPPEMQWLWDEKGNTVVRFFLAISRGQQIAIKTHLLIRMQESLVCTCCLNPVCPSLERPNNCMIQWISE